MEELLANITTYCTQWHSGAAFLLDRLDREEMIKMNTMLEKAKAIEQQIIEDRRKLHQIPEFGLYTPNTAAYVRKRLDEMGIENRMCGNHGEEDKELMRFVGYPDWPTSTGVVGLIGKGGPCFLLRADMDGLPIKEETGLPFSSTNGAGHMCGHDSHAAMLLGAAKILKDMEDELPGTVKLMFQPGEEMGYGSRTMIEDGLMENPKVDAAFGLHIQPQQKPGTFAYCSSVTSGSMATFFITITGRGGHSSEPDKCIDPVVIATELSNALQLIIPREIEPDVFATMTVGAFNAGTASNIIPNTAELQISIRTLSPKAYDHLLKRVPEMVDGYVKAWRGTYTLRILKTPGTVCTPDTVSEIAGYAKQIFGDENVYEQPPMKGAEDFAHVAKMVPAAFGFMGGGEGDYPLHNSHMVLDESSFIYGSAVLANAAVEWLKAHK